jgi:hypothetical protein
MTKASWRRIVWAGVFGIAMGYFEASVVVYLRALFYPRGFSFPLVNIRSYVLYVELVREVMSLGMMACIAALAGRNFIERFGFFCYTFGVWDIFYYVFLKMTINWPESLLTWDVLFLIPVPWVGPVWAPILCSLFFILFCLLIVRAEDLGSPLRPHLVEWCVSILGGMMIIVSFCEEFQDIIAEKKPQSFAWHLFLLGLGLGIASFVRAYLRTIRQCKM